MEEDREIYDLENSREDSEIYDPIGDLIEELENSRAEFEDEEEYDEDFNPYDYEDEEAYQL